MKAGISHIRRDTARTFLGRVDLGNLVGKTRSCLPNHLLTNLSLEAAARGLESLSAVR